MEPQQLWLRRKKNEQRNVSSNALILENVVVAFGALKAVNDVSLRINKGQRHAIIGPNGAGKTTLFNAISGLHPATSGRVVFQGRDISRMPAHLRARLGISRTFQITNLFPSLTVRENMLLALFGNSAHKYSLLGNMRVSNQEQSQIEAALTTTRLGPKGDTAVQELSYGEQRQLEMAMALVTKPELLLLDEPAAGLSPAERVIVSDIIKALSRDLTMILIEHDMELVLKLVDSVTCLNNGNLLAEGTPAEISQNQHVKDVYLGKARE